MIERKFAAGIVLSTAQTFFTCSGTGWEILRCFRSMIPLFLIAISCNAIAVDRYAEIEAKRVDKIAALIPAHPAGFGSPCADRDVWGRSETSTRLKSVIDAADKLLDQNFPAWDDRLYLEYSERGIRPNGERMMNARKAWLYPLVLAECVTNTGRYIPSIEKVLNELDEQPVWNWPAHDRNLRNFRNHDFEVDLLAADMAHDIAQALYMLGDRISPSVRRKTLFVMEQRVFGPVRRSLITGNKDHWWLHANHNWNAVCLKGVVAAALTILESRADRAIFAAAGEHYISYYLSGFPSDGYSMEGPGYWNYGFSHFTELRESLLVATKGRLDIYADAKVRAIALYGYQYEMLPDNNAPFGDSSPRTRFDDFTRAYANRAFGLGQPQQLPKLQISPSQPGNTSPIADAVLKLFAEPSPPSGPLNQTTRIEPQSYFDSVGVLVSRPGASGGIAVSIKAGGNGNHSHNDIGSYSIGLGNEQPTGDPGKTDYSSKTFSKERYTIRGINSWGHPVPVIDGQLQRDATQVVARVLKHQFSNTEDRLVIDMAGAYPVQEIRLLTRSMIHQRTDSGNVLIEDRFEFTSPKRFEVAAICSGNWQLVGQGGFECWQKKQHVRAYVESSAAYEFVNESITEEGLAFTRIAVRLKTPQTRGFVRIRFLPR